MILSSWQPQQRYPGELHQTQSCRHLVQNTRNNSLKVSRIRQIVPPGVLYVQAFRFKCAVEQGATDV
jgi:hypothetical protein